MNKFLILLAVIGVGLFMGNYSICMWAYPPEKYPTYVEWWALKQNIYNIVIAIFQFLAFYCIKDVVLKTIMCFGFMVCFSNIVDRLYFNVNNFQTNDIAMLVFAVILSTVFYYKNEKNGGGNKGVL